MADTRQSICRTLVLWRSVRTDMSDTSKQARVQIFHLISESMEARMQSLEALRRLQSTIKAIQELRTNSWPGSHADKLDQQIL